MEIKNIIRQRRLELGLTYEELGKIVGVGKSTVRKWETGMIENIKRDNIVALSKALNISPALIMGWDEENIKANNLSDEDNSLLDNFHKLNDLGKKEAVKRVSELTEIYKYTKFNNEITTFAAHTDENNPEFAKHDEEIAKKFISELKNKKNR